MGEDGDKGVDMVMRGMWVRQVGCGKDERDAGEVREMWVRCEGCRRDVRDAGEV